MRLALEKGFFFPSSEIYSGPAGFWEYGPLGVGFRNKFVEVWRRELLRKDGMLEIDGSQIMTKDVFRASGHLDSFTDPIVKCKKCGSIFRADRLVSEKTGTLVTEGSSEKELDDLIEKHLIRCSRCGADFGGTKKFNLMMSVEIGGDKEEAYLRPETCQSIFVDFLRIFKVMRCKLPVAIAQFGKSFRNEISPRQSMIRLREFYQCEIEIFFNPNQSDVFQKYDGIGKNRLRVCLDGKKSQNMSCSELLKKGILPSQMIAYYLVLLQSFYEKTGLDMTRARFRLLSDAERAFYSSFAFDFEVETSMGWTELVACNYRTDYDLVRHGQTSGREHSVMDGEAQVVPHIFELSMGVDRSIWAILEHSLTKHEERDVLELKPYLAPIQIGVFPLVNRDGMEEKAAEVLSKIRKDFNAFYDRSGSIGRRYRRADEIGVPKCLTIDTETLANDTVTIRDRDSMKQSRVHLDELRGILNTTFLFPD